MAVVTAAFVVIIALLKPAVGTESGDPLWDYEGHILGPPFWATRFPDCGLNVQSPVDIQVSQTVHAGSLQPFVLSSYNTLAASAAASSQLENAGGHTVKLSFSGVEAGIGGGNLSSEYVLDQLHFHWGKDDSRGSEHRLNGVPAPMEMHIVHHLKSAPVADAPVKPYGLAVLAFFFRVRSENNTALDPLISRFKDIAYRGEKVTLTPAFNLTRLLPLSPGSGPYYRYFGSLTTPPCHQSVIWTIFKNRIDISSKQLQAFRALQRTTAAEGGTSHPIEDNFRPGQNLNGRFILSNDPNLTSGEDDEAD